MTRVVLATSNQGKVAEMQSSLREIGFEILPQSDFSIPDAVEDGLSFVENAIKKARHASQLTGFPAIADDSGLEVDALDGAPGIYSARYAQGQEGSGDAANNRKLLANMKGVQNRNARFQCVLVYMLHAMDPTPVICQGSWEGQIATGECGSNGFGYDPLFYVPELKRHSAELEPSHKKQVSHRGKALVELKRALKQQHKYT